MRISDLPIDDLLKIILVMQFLLIFTMALDTLGLHIPILRELIGFIYLIFVPGLLLLRLLSFERLYLLRKLGLKRLGNIHTILYSVGLSITTIMFTGFLMNTIYPSFGILNPISIFPLIITISTIVLILCLLNYIMEESFYKLTHPNLKGIFNKKRYIGQYKQLYRTIMDSLDPSIIFLCILPFLAILGTYLVNVNQNNILLMILIIFIAVTAILVSFNKISKKVYPFAVFVIALSLLYHTSMSSMNLVGWDIHMEYYVSNLVVTNSYWDTSLSTEYNAMLSLTMLAPIFSIVSGISLTWVFKIIYPFIFALVPLGLYVIFKNQTDNDKIAFLSCFLFISLFSFYDEMIALARQEIGELFLVLILLLFIDNKMSNTRKYILFSLFIFSIIVSHYSLSYIYLFYVIIAWLILFLIDNLKIGKLTDKLNVFKYKKYFNILNLTDFKKLMGLNENRIGNKLINLNFILLFLISTLTWYMFVSDSHTLYVFTSLCGNILTNMADFLSPKTGEGLNIIVSGGTQSFMHLASKYLHLTTQFFILIGIVGVLKVRMNFKRENFIFAVISVLMLVSSIAVPYFGASLNTTRIYQITLIFLAPFCIMGSMIFFDNAIRLIKFIMNDIIKISRFNLDFMRYKLMSMHIKNDNQGNFNIHKIVNIKSLFGLFPSLFNCIRVSWNNKNNEKYLKITSIVLVIYLLFNSGFIYEITNDQHTSFSLSQASIQNSSDDDKSSIYTILNTYKQDTYSVQWFDTNVEKKQNTTVYADLISRQPLMESGIGITYGYRIPLLNSSVSQINPGNFIFLGYVNVRKNLLVTSKPGGFTPELSYILANSNRVYSNGGGDIYLV